MLQYRVPSYLQKMIDDYKISLTDLSTNGIIGLRHLNWYLRYFGEELVLGIQLRNVSSNNKVSNYLIYFLLVKLLSD